MEEVSQVPCEVFAKQVGDDLKNCRFILYKSRNNPVPLVSMKTKTEYQQGFPCLAVDVHFEKIYFEDANAFDVLDYYDGIIEKMISKDPRNKNGGGPRKFLSKETRERVYLIRNAIPKLRNPGQGMKTVFFEQQKSLTEKIDGFIATF